MIALHDDILPELIADIRSHHDPCAIVLIGSVAESQQRPDSDLDINLFLPDEPLSEESRYVRGDNKWQLKVLFELKGIRIDVAWETYNGLRRRLQGDGPLECWPFSNGKILWDPEKEIEPLLAMARRWYQNRKDIEASVRAKYTRAKLHQNRQRRR